MRHEQELKRELQRIDGRPYPAYRDLRGRYQFEWGVLAIDHVQGDPFASPSRLSIEIPHQQTGIPDDALTIPPRRTGAENFIASGFASACHRSAQSLGSGKSGMLQLDSPGPEVIRRSCCSIGKDVTRLQFSAGLPANGRRISAQAAATLLLEAIPDAIRHSLTGGALDIPGLSAASNANEDAETLRQMMADQNLLAFIADGAILPRASGVDDRPLPEAKPFRSPDSMRTNFHLPHAGQVSGMGISEGVTLVVGGGFHGKSTLLNAIERGVYNHRPGDGRELVVTRNDAVKVRAEDGRFVASVDISAFLSDLPDGQDTRAFSTTNASGSTSQAAAIIEAIEAGSRLLLLDEDISATNFLIRDQRMRELISSSKEPITPFVERVRAMADEERISTIMVLGGSGDYFEAAHRVIAMETYEAHDLTAEAKRIAAKHQHDAHPPVEARPLLGKPRIIDPSSLNPYKKAGPYRGSQQNRGASRPPRRHVRAHGTRGLSFGTEELDLSLLASLVDEAQLRAIGLTLARMSEKHLKESMSLTEAIQASHQELLSAGFEILTEGPPVDLAEFRIHELAAALNRLRSLKISKFH